MDPKWSTKAYPDRVPKYGTLFAAQCEFTTIITMVKATKYKPVLAREREARFKEERFRNKCKRKRKNDTERDKERKKCRKLST